MNRKDGNLFQKIIRKIKLYWYHISSGYFKLSKLIKTNILNHRLFSILVCIGIVVLAFVLGEHHKNKEEYIKAMTVSDIKQSISFSQTGASFKLYPQKRNDDMTVLPFKLENIENQSTNAEDYKVTLMPIMRSELPKNIKTSIVFFGSTGEGAIAIKGDLPKEPIATIVTNNSDFASEQDDKGEGEITIAGKDTKVDYNGVGFTINAKANNVKKDKLINPDMSMSDLYYSLFAKKQLRDIEENFNKSKEKERQLKNEEASRIKDIKKANKALDRDENDVSYDNNEDTSDDSVVTSGSTMAETINDTDTSNTDIKSLRNSTIDDLESIRGQIKSEQDYQEGTQIEAKKVENFTKTKVFDLLSINSKTELRKNDDVK